ncbi:MAG: CRISPR-associated endonuclease Cas1, partial [Anaerolineae bacterium]
MPVIYLTDQGAMAHKKGERLIVEKKSDVILDMPLIHVEQLVVMGNVQLSAALITQLLLQEVDVAFFSSYGKYRGRLTPPALGFAQLRHRQYQVLGNAQTALPIAKQAIQAKLANQRRTLGRLAATAGSQVQATVLRATQTMQGIEGQVGAARDLDSLRGYEG